VSAYRCIIADPPWQMPTRGGYSWRKGRRSGRARELDYPPMTLDEIRSIGVEDHAAADAFLWLWTPMRYLEAAPGVCRAWGFTPLSTCVWSKPPFGWNPGGKVFATVTEFFILAERGNPRALRRWEQQVFTWSRVGEHSTKPPAFYELVEQTCEGPRLELFQRVGRIGWDAAGNEALATIEVAGVANA
jgi:N6-adenosine-specific RNA methylase IME4